MSESKSFYLWLLQVISLLGLTALLLWLSLRSKSPSYTIVVLDLNGTAATLSVEDGYRNSTISFDLEIANPNKESGIYYDIINITLHLDDVYIGSTNIDPFYQGFHKTANRNDNIVADRGFRKAVFWAVRNGTVDLKMGVVTRVRYRIWAWKTKHHGLGFQGNESWIRWQDLWEEESKVATCAQEMEAKVRFLGIFIFFKFWIEELKVEEIDNGPSTFSFNFWC